MNLAALRAVKLLPAFLARLIDKLRNPHVGRPGFLVSMSRHPHTAVRPGRCACLLLTLNCQRLFARSRHTQFTIRLFESCERLRNLVSSSWHERDCNGFVPCRANPIKPSFRDLSRGYPMRLHFSSIHCYLDPSSGAALCTRELLELLAARGMDCRVLTTGILDPERETSLDEVFATLELPVRRFQAELGTGRAAEVIDLSVNGVRVTLMPTVSSRAERSPDLRESAIFLELADQVFDRFRPDVLLTYGGHPASLELMRRARQRGIAVVFHLHNFGYTRATMAGPLPTSRP